MGQRIISAINHVCFCLVIGLVSSTGWAADTTTSKPIPQIAWKSIDIAQKKVLAPLEKDWNQLTGIQQRRLITAAKQYPKMVPIQQERFQERLKDWAALTPEQRRVARDKFQDMSKLPPEKQHELRERWNAKSASHDVPVEPNASPK